MGNTFHPFCRPWEARNGEERAEGSCPPCFFMSMNLLQLPIFDIRQDFSAAIRQGKNVVLSAPTGSGKSTQIPKMLLEDLPSGQRVLVLQPRRLAARMCAERIAEELGEQAGQTVGYVTRYERQARADTRILFITEGILARMLLNPSELDGTGAIVFDEFHERSIHGDLGLALARRLQRSGRPDLLLVVMSATLQAAPIMAYLGNCEAISASGRLFPVAVTYTHRNPKYNIYQSAAQALAEVAAANPEGDILVFMPGAAEIRHCIEECTATCRGQALTFLPLYGEMPPEAQHAVMKPAKPGFRNVIVATNIAETSLTIPGVRHVIDSGLVKINVFDSMRGVNMLETQAISRDSADQRAGRAGRLAPGTCRRLWSELEQNGRPQKTSPEIERIDLCDAILTLAAAGIHDFVAFPWFEAPPEKMANAAVSLLQQLGLLTADGHLTELGGHVRRFPVHPRIGLLLWLGAKHGCYGLACRAAALLSERRLMQSASGNRAQFTEYRGGQRRNSKREGIPESDFLAQIQLLHEAAQRHFDVDFCNRAGIQAAAARDICRAVKDFEQAAPIVCDTSASPSNIPPEATFLKCLLQAFPDRLVRRLDVNASLVCELQGRRRAEIAANSLVRDESFAIVGELREISGSGVQKSKIELSLLSGVKEDWLWELFPNDFEDRDEIFWDDAKQQVFRRRLLLCRNLVLEEKITNDPAPEKAACILAEQLSANNMQLLGWDDDCNAWIDRVRWLADVFPEQGLPMFSEDDVAKIRHDVCMGETSYRAVKNKPCLDFIKGIMTHAQIVFVEKMAPSVLPLPRGRKLKIEYHPGQTPRGRARIQELYDVTGDMTVAGGRVKLLLDILAPNMRTVQITDDLPRFWQIHYPSIKSALARRYPKHEWR